MGYTEADTGGILSGADNGRYTVRGRYRGVYSQRQILGVNKGRYWGVHSQVRKDDFSRVRGVTLLLVRQNI